MKKIKHKVNVESIDEEYQSIVKPEMTNYEVGQLGMIVLKTKISRLKNKLFGWYYDRKTKKKNQKKIR